MLILHIVLYMCDMDTPAFIKTVPSMYTLLMIIIHLTVCTKVAEGIVFRNMWFINPEQLYPDGNLGDNFFFEVLFSKFLLFFYFITFLCLWEVVKKLEFFGDMYP